MPYITKIHQKVEAAINAEKLKLDMSDWHNDACGTTHCRAGMIVFLAGDAGRALEKQTSTLFAAMEIAKKSGLPISPVRFFDSDEKAMKDIIATAEKEREMQSAQLKGGLKYAANGIQHD